MGQRLAVEDVAALQFSLGRLPIRGIVPDLPAGHHIDHVGRMGVDLFLHAGRQFRFEDAHPFVLELHLYRLGVYHRRILRPDRACQNDESNYRYNWRNDESHTYEQAFLEGELQAVNDNGPAFRVSLIDAGEPGCQSSAMKTIRCGILLFLLLGVDSIAFGDVPKMNIEILDLAGRTTFFKGATDPRGIFVSPKVPPGEYAVCFTSKGAAKGSHYTLVLVAGTKKMAASAITAEKLAADGVAMKIEVKSDRSILGQVAEEDKMTRIGKNGKLMVWIPKRIGSNLAAHWAESDSAEARLVETGSSFSRQNIQERQNKGISPGD